MAWPSSLVMMTEPTLTASLNAAAWSCAACPIELPPARSQARPATRCSAGGAPRPPRPSRTLPSLPSPPHRRAVCKLADTHRPLSRAWRTRTAARRNVPRGPGPVPRSLAAAIGAAPPAVLDLPRLQAEPLPSRAYGSVGGDGCSTDGWGKSGAYLSRTKTTSSGLTAAAICCISSKSDASCLCLPPTPPSSAHTLAGCIR